MTLDRDINWEERRSLVSNEGDQAPSRTENVKIEHLDRQRILKCKQHVNYLYEKNQPMFCQWIQSELDSLLHIGLRFDVKGKLGMMLQEVESTYLDTLKTTTYIERNTVDA